MSPCRPLERSPEPDEAVLSELLSFGLLVLPQRGGGGEASQLLPQRGGGGEDSHQLPLLPQGGGDGAGGGGGDGDDDAAVELLPQADVEHIFQPE